MGRPNSGRDKLAFLFWKEMELKLLFWTLIFFFLLRSPAGSHSISLSTDWKQRSSTASDPSASLNVLVCCKSLFYTTLFTCIWNDFHHMHTEHQASWNSYPFDIICCATHLFKILRMYWVFCVQSAVFDQGKPILPFSNTYQNCLISCNLFLALHVGHFTHHYLLSSHCIVSAVTCKNSARVCVNYAGFGFGGAFFCSLLTLKSIFSTILESNKSETHMKTA